MSNQVTVSIKNVDAKVEITEIINQLYGVRTAYTFTDKQNEDNIEVSDGYHTMEELYDHRHALFLALVKVYDNYITPLSSTPVKCWKSKTHDDGSTYDGWFLLGMTVTKTSFVEGQPPEKFDISYHLPMKYWGMANVVELPKAPPFEGYTPKDVIARLHKL